MTGLEPVGFRSWAGVASDLPASLPGRWVAIEAAGLDGHSRVRAFVDLRGAPDAVFHQRVFLHRKGRGVFEAVLFVPREAATIALGVQGALRSPDRARLSEPRPIGAGRAALRLFRRDPARFASVPGAAVRGVAGARAALRSAQAAVIGGCERDALDHHGWFEIFSTWLRTDPAGELGLGPDAARISMLVFDPGDDRAASAATRRGISRQTVPVGAATVRPGQDWRRVLDTPGLASCEYVGLLQAGEVPVPHAARLAGLLLAQAGRPALATSDLDRLGRGGHRSEPRFLPTPNHALMLSGTLAQGLWLVRRDALLAHAGRAGDAAPEASGADGVRLALWLTRRRAGEPDGIRLPHILAGTAAGTRRSPPGAMAAIVRDHLERAHLPFTVQAGVPLRLDPAPGPDPIPVTAIVPSTLRAPHAARCIDAILRDTGGVALEIVVAVAQPEPLDEAQRTVAARLEAAHPNLRVEHLPCPRFNFAWTVNRIAEGVDPGRHVLLLNDDVSPLDRDWLVRMSMHLADPRVGAVGAKLFYPFGTVQHGGIVMGLAGLCEHAFRHAPGDTRGPDDRACLPQRLLAATGACLLVRGSVMRAVGGMDEGYPSAFNDVDLCLRIDESGHEVVMEAGAHLTHHELLTYGAHHAGERAAFLDAEVARMRARWPDAIADDRYYSPNLDLRPEHAFEPACPPRRPGGRIARRGTAS